MTAHKAAGKASAGQALSFQDVAEWEAWLASHHEEPGGAWLKVSRKGSPRPTITAAEAGDVALCYGWIDSARRSLDDQYFLQRYSRRRPRGPWSQLNVERAEALEAAGRMRGPGVAEMNAAKADGRWQAPYGSQRNATVPADLQAALAANGRAAEAFSQLGKTARYLVILPLLKSRTPGARATQLGRIIDKLGESRPASGLGSVEE